MLRSDLISSTQIIKGKQLINIDLDHTFFVSDIKKFKEDLHKQIFDLAINSEGALSPLELYQLPRTIRLSYVLWMNQLIEKKNAASNKGKARSKK